MTGYADVEDPVALLNRAPDTSGGPTIEDAIREAGFQVQAVNWVWERVVGEDLVTSIIEPITGDFEKIAQQAGQWSNIKDALQAIRNNLNAGLGELQPAWQGEAGDNFRNLIGTTWTLGIEADAQAANLIGLALNKVADGSRRACDECLNLISSLVDKLIQAAAMLPIPVVGWGRAVKLVYDGIQLYNAIMRLIEGIKAIIEGAQQVIQGIQQVGTALSKIDDIRNLNDALNVANETGEGIATTAQGASSVRDGLGDVRQGATDAASAGASARDNAGGLQDERAAARDQGGTQTDSDDATGSPNGNRGNDTGQPNDGEGDGRPTNPDDTRTPENNRVCENDPIDVATGEMVLGQTDVELAGVLPLVLKRTHVSSYRAGRMFGRTWASTLDQRLELDNDGVVFVADDGMLLVYPEPAAGSPVLPKVGPRWPLSRTDDGYTVTQTQAGNTLHFPGTDSGITRLAAITDRNGNRVAFDRGDDGIVTDVRHSGGYHIGVTAEHGRVTGLRQRGPAGDLPLLRFRYHDGNLAEVVNSTDLALRFDYDQDGRITRWTDRNDQWYGYRYDADGRCVANEGSDGLLSGAFSYDRDARVTRFVDALGNTTTYLMDERNNIVAETDPLGNVTTSERDAGDRLVSRTDPLGRTTRYEYDAAGNITTVTRPDGTRLVAEHNQLGLPVTVVDPDGATWRRDFDERGNLRAVTDPTGAVTTYTHNDRGHVMSTTDALGNTRYVRTNGAGLPVTVTDPLGATTNYALDQFGRVTAITDPMGGVARFGWTIEGKLRSHRQPDGSTETWRYDGEGNEIEHVDALGQVSATEYGGFDLPAARTGPDGARTAFGYDPNLNLVSVTNPQGLVWRYEYDAAANLVRETDFNGRTVTYTHDTAGQLASRTNGAGETVTFARDPLGHVVERRAGDSTTTFAYDPAGRLLHATGPDVDLSYGRDPLGRVVAETVDGRTVSSTYDALGRRLLRRTPTGAESRWRYDGDGKPVELTAGGHTVRFGYDRAGREVRRGFGAGTMLNRSWDANHRLASQTLTAPGRQTAAAQVVQQRAYHYRPDGSVIRIDDMLSGRRGFELDRAGRVTAVNGQGWTERYAYDGAGNLTSATWPATSDGSGTPEAQGQREYAGTLLRHAGNTTYQHDAQGRVVTVHRRTLSGQRHAWTYTWDADDRLVGLVTPDGARWRYRYDALGRRVAKQRLGTDGAGTDLVLEQVNFAWDGPTLAEQTSTDGPSGKAPATTTWDWEPGTFHPVTQIERAPLRGAPQDWVDQQFYALVTDIVGTPTELVRPDGGLAWRARTTLWGQALAGLANGPHCPLRFPGQYHDVETGLNYNVNRYYRPESGRYDSADPLGLDGGDNPHAYVVNPIGWTDPLGLTPCSNAARRDAMRAYGLPNNARMVSQEQYSAGYQYVYEVQTAEGPRLIAVTDQTTDRVEGHGPHWEVGEVKPEGEYGRDPLGRLRVRNEGKSKQEYE